MSFRYSFVAVGLASAFVAGCNMSQDHSTATFESTIESNAAAAEAAEAEVAKLNAVEKADEKPAHGEAKKGKGAKAAEHKAKGSGKTSAEHKTATTPRKPASNSKNSVYIVQIGAFRVKGNAERLHSKLKSDGFPVLLREMNHSKNGQLFLVRMEPTPNRQEAETMATSLKTKSELVPTIIVRPEGD